MKRWPRVVYVLAVTLATLFMVPPTNRAQQEGNPQILSSSHYASGAVRARTIQNSSVVVTLRFTFDNGVYMLVSQHDGAMVRIERRKQILGFTPYFPEGPDGPVALRVFKINRVTKNGKFVGEAMSERETYLVSQEAVSYKVSDLLSTIEFVGVNNNPQPGHKDFTTQDVQPLGDHNECCVTCDGVRACACAVSANCGSCCIGDCCG